MASIWVSNPPMSSYEISGTSSSSKCSTSGCAKRSSNKPLRTSRRNKSPLRRCVPRSASASSHTRSSSPRPVTMARMPSSSTSLSDTTSPVMSAWRAITTLSDSFNTTSLPRSSVWRSISGCNDTRILRPLVSTSTLPSSLEPTTTP